jgi:hypothetical protein
MNFLVGTKTYCNLKVNTNRFGGAGGFFFKIQTTELLHLSPLALPVPTPQLSSIYRSWLPSMNPKMAPRRFRLDPHSKGWTVTVLRP